MNRYGNMIGVHTPARSAAAKLFIEKASGIKFEDASWHNDPCDSIANSDLNIQVFIPNSLVQDLSKYKFNTYSVCSYNGNDNEKVKSVADTLMTFKELIKFLRSIEEDAKKEDVEKEFKSNINETYPFQVAICPNSEVEGEFMSMTFEEAIKVELDSTSVHYFVTRKEREAFISGYRQGVGWLGKGFYVLNDKE